jgi:hypothetical protein
VGTLDAEKTALLQQVLRKFFYCLPSVSYVMSLFYPNCVDRQANIEPNGLKNCFSNACDLKLGTSCPLTCKYTNHSNAIMAQRIRIHGYCALIFGVGIIC